MRERALLVAGLVPDSKQDGYRVAPFKSQNMALNSFVTKEGLEMGKAQVSCRQKRQESLRWSA